MGNGQTQPSSLPCRFGREERVEKMFARVFIQTGTVILNKNVDEITITLGRNFNQALALATGSFNGMDSIVENVEDDLVYLRQGTDHLGNLSVALDDLGGVFNVVMGNFQGAVDTLVDVCQLAGSLIHPTKIH